MNRRLSWASGLFAVTRVRVTLRFRLAPDTLAQFCPETFREYPFAPRCFTRDESTSSPTFRDTAAVPLPVMSLRYDAGLEEPVRKNPPKKAITAAFVLSGLYLFFWPVTVFIYGLTGPHSAKTARGLAVELSWIGILSYPVVWGAAFFAARWCLKHAKNPETAYLLAAIPYLLLIVSYGIG